MKKVVILGAGFAGLELATRLSEDVPDAVDITIIDSSDAFVFGFSKLDLMFGRADLDTVRLPYARIDKPSVRFVRETITAIDPERRRVVTDGATYEPDILVVALGADVDPAATPGVVEEGTEYYSVEGANRVRRHPAHLRRRRRHRRRARALLQVPGRTVRDRHHAARLSREARVGAMPARSKSSARCRSRSRSRTRRRTAS